jgi:hypothetical protein
MLPTCYDQTFYINNKRCSSLKTISFESKNLLSSMSIEGILTFDMEMLKGVHPTIAFPELNSTFELSGVILSLDKSFLVWELEDCLITRVQESFYSGEDTAIPAFLSEVYFSARLYNPPRLSEVENVYN